MKKQIIKFLVSALAVVAGSYLLGGFGVGVDSFWTAFVVAIAISLINIFVKPILVLFTLPITVLTLGLFLIVINAFTFYLAGYLVDGFVIPSMMTAVGFSFLYSIALSILESVLGIEGKE